MSSFDIVLHAIALLMMLYIADKEPFLRNFGKYIVLLTFWISLMFMPAFHLVKNLAGSEGLRGYVITMIDYNRILSFGSKVLIVTCVAWILTKLFYRGEKRVKYVYTPKLFSKKSIKLSFVVVIGLSLFSFSIGLSRMGAKGVELPFHLAGIISLIRITFFPLFCASILENYILCKKKIPKVFFYLLFIWGGLEVIVRLSKGALIGAFLPLGIVWYIYKRPTIVSMAKYVLPLFAIFIFMYPIVEAMRHTEGGSLSSSFVSASQEVEDKDEAESAFMQPLNRTFMIPHMYAKDYQWVGHNTLFDFSKAPIIMAWGGAARYQTFVIDGYPLGIAHSSGTTALQDPLLHGGYGLCYIVIILLVFAGGALDSMAYKGMWSIYISLVLLLWGFCNTQNITSFYDSVSLQYILARILAILVAYRVNFSRKVIISKE